MWTLAAHAQPGDAVLLISGDRYPVFLYHYNRRFPAGEGPQVYLMPVHSTRFTPANVESELAPLAEQHPRLWLASFERSLQDPGDLARGWLDRNLTGTLSVPLGHNDLRLYAERDQAPTVDAGAFQPQYPLSAPRPVTGETSLIGYDLATTEFRPGDTVRLALYLAQPAGQEPRQDVLDVTVDWVHQGGQVIATQTLSVPAPGDSAQAARVLAALDVYEYTPPGQYWVDVYGSDGTTDAIRLPAGRVTHSQHLPTSDIAVKESIELAGGDIEFLGYTLNPHGSLKAGDPLTVDLYWRAGSHPEVDYTAFVHLLGSYNPATGGPVWAQDDAYPLAGGHPTTRWLPGQIVRDRHVLVVPANTLPGRYQIEVGLYDARTGTRLPVAGSDEDRILLDDIEINP
jgi:hypothetical protein